MGCFSHDWSNLIRRSEWEYCPSLEVGHTLLFWLVMSVRIFLSLSLSLPHYDWWFAFGVTICFFQFLFIHFLKHCYWYRCNSLSFFILNLPLNVLLNVLYSYTIFFYYYSIVYFFQPPPTPKKNKLDHCIR